MLLRYRNEACLRGTHGDSRVVNPAKREEVTRDRDTRSDRSTTGLADLVIAVMVSALTTRQQPESAPEPRFYKDEQQNGSTDLTVASEADLFFNSGPNFLPRDASTTYAFPQ